MQNKALGYALMIAAILALFVVMLGAYTRLTDAGLGCPDWPGCYGRLVLPSMPNELQSAQTNYPQIPLETAKAWTEMAHRYAAGTLGLLIFVIVVIVLWRRLKGQRLPWLLPLMLIFLVIFQAALGMWTVTLKLLPVVVMGHLLGGILIFACLCRLALGFLISPSSALTGTFSRKSGEGSMGAGEGGIGEGEGAQGTINTPFSRLREKVPEGRMRVKSGGWHFWIGLGALIVFCQIALGGWVSSNYAGIACIGFPKCNGQWLPQLYFSQGFNLFSPVGANYQGGLLDNEIRVTIQFIHRLGAIVTALYLLVLSSSILAKVDNTYLRLLALLALIFVLLQFLLGVINVVYLLPLWVAVAHNGVAALLMAFLLMMLYLSRGRFSDAG